MEAPCAIVSRLEVSPSDTVRLSCANSGDTNSLIQATGISKAFDGESILSDVDISLQPGEVVGIVGPGGVGKSLLLKILCGLVMPDSGEVQIRGQVWSELTVTEKASLRESFGMLFQNHALFDFMTVGDNVAFPLRQRLDIANDEIERRVTERLAQVELPGVHWLFFGSSQAV